ncbi:alpha-galactosidase [Catenulispora sp. GP43]|uniref:alpha-galactosidase D n=1 Tax=Catenulispora sp. GP43 TaxID=3156263 RepID=UPI0035146149
MPRTHTSARRRALRPLPMAAALLVLAVGSAPAATASGPRSAVATPPLGNGLALTPPMGWNAWNSLGTQVTEQDVLQTIDFMSASGMAAAGYKTVTIDDGWSLLHRTGQTTDQAKTSYGALQLYDAAGNPVSGLDGTGNDPTSGDLIPDPRNFAPQTVNGQTLNGIAYLAWYAHSKGMKLGLYTSVSYLTCQGHPGSLGHEATDAADFVSWGVDYVKDDSCPDWSGPNVPVSPSDNTHGEGKELSQSIYTRAQTFQRALDAASTAQGKPKVTFSVSAQPAHIGAAALLPHTDPAWSDSVIQAYAAANPGAYSYQAPGFAPVGLWCGQVANLCRIGGDRSSDLNGVFQQLGQSLQFAANIRPGSWNDMDMMFTGWIDPYHAPGTSGVQPSFTDTESRTEMSILSMMASPLISGADLRTAAQSVHTSGATTWSSGINAASLAIYENTGVIAVDQDPLGKPASLVQGSPGNGTSPVILKRQLANGDTAVALINQDPNNSQTISTTLSALGLSGSAYNSTDLWNKTTSTISGSLGATVAPHGVALYRISATTAPPTSATYEAESPTNTLSGGADIQGCPQCSGGAKVGYVGNGGLLQFNNVNVATAGTYNLTIAYCDGSAAGRSATISVNGTTAATLAFTPTPGNWYSPLTTKVSLNLRAGDNTIILSNPTGWAPDFDRITVSSQ